jgi:hypothetical protein
MSNWVQRKKRGEREIPGAVRIEYVAAYLNPELEILDGEEISWNSELESYMIECMPMYYSVKDYMIGEIEPYLK